MSFADNLRQQAQDEILKEEQKEQAKLDAIKKAEDIKKAFFATRHEAILSGEAVASFYENFKQKLMEVANRCISDESKHRSGTFVYHPEELAQKEAYYKDMLEKRAEYYHKLDPESSSDFERARRSLSPLYYDTITPYKVFSEEEVTIISKQLEEVFSIDGLRCSIKTGKNFKTIYEEIDFRHWKTICDEFLGYTIEFDAKWHPWDTSKPISDTCLEKIRIKCLEYKNDPDYVYIWEGRDRKFLTALGLKRENIYLHKDTTLFCSGKEGWAITPEGIYLVKKGLVRKQSFQELADEIGYKYFDPGIFSIIKQIVRDDLT